MKIEPVAPPHNDADPYKGDLFNRRPFGASLKRLMSEIEDNAVICLDEDWGMGKSTFLRMWKGSLEQDKISLLSFNAFENEIYGSPFTMLTAEIEAFLRTNFATSSKLKSAASKIHKSAVEIGRRILLAGLRVGLKATTGIALDGLGIGDDLTKSSTQEVIDDVLKSESDDLAKKKAAVVALKAELANAAAIVRESQNFPLLIVVDELDRCSPDYSLQVLEHIAHFFDVNSVVFLIACNMNQIANHARTKYGLQTDGDRYLQKFFNIRLSFPRINIGNSVSDTERYLRHQFAVHGIQSLLNDMATVFELCDFYRMSYREIDQVAILMAVYKHSFDKARLPLLLLILFLAIVKIRFPATFREVLEGKCKLSEFFEAVDFNNYLATAKSKQRSQWLALVLRYHFLSGSEVLSPGDKEGFAALDNQYFRYSYERGELLKHYCEDISSFMQ